MTCPNVIFVQPFNLSAALAENCGKRVVVVDVAFDAQGFERTTLPFIEALGDRLIAYVDHHPHTLWSDPRFASDPRFVLVPREQAPACPPILTQELVQSWGEIDTIIAHGDFDGVMSAVMVATGGIEPYKGAIADSIAADSRIGKLSSIGQRLEDAIKADLREDAPRHAIFNELVYGDAGARQKVSEAAQRYLAIQANTAELAKGYEVDGKVAYVTAIDVPTFDLTQLLLSGQKLAQFAIVVQNQRIGKTEVSIACKVGTVNLVQLFSLSGGAPNVVHLPDQNLAIVLEALNSLV
ncbi:hypothetical protein KAZ57_01520 [Patescibacteria group bacterium]|nr:hypothetical protein [Patescibacteria group bacterium]